MGNRLAITGVTNNPGRVLIECISRNQAIVDGLYPEGILAVTRESSDVGDYVRLIPSGDRFICDLTNVEKLKEAFRDVDTVLHIAGIHWSREVFKAAAYCGVKRIITVHTCGVYSKYKKAGEEYRQIDSYCRDICREHNITLTVFRPTMIYGNSKDRNVVKFIKMVDRLSVMPVVNGAKYALQPVHYKDVGEALYASIVNEKATGGKDFILSGATPILLRDMLTEIGNNLNKKVRFISFPFWFSYMGAIAFYLVSFGKFDYREKVQRLCENRAFDHEDATLAFGFSPRSFEEGVVDEIREYQAK